MDNQDSSRCLPSPAINLINRINQLKVYEQNIVDCMNQRIKSLKAKQERNEANTDELNQLESSLTQYYQHIELDDFYKMKMCNEIGSLQHLSEDINQGLYETFAVLSSIDNLSTVSNNIISTEKAEIERTKVALKSEIISLDDELQTMKVQNEQDLKEFGVELDNIEKQIEENSATENICIDEINILLNEDSDLESQLKLGENALNNKEEYVFELTSETESLQIETCSIDEKISEHKTKLNEDELELDKWNSLQLKLNDSLKKIENEILFLDEENNKLQTHEIFKISKEEERTYENLVNQHTQQLNELKENVSSLDCIVLEEKNKQVKMVKEITVLETTINDQKLRLVELDEQVKACESESINRELEDCKEKTRAVFDQFFIINTEATQLKSRIRDLEEKIKTIPSINDENIHTLYAEKDNVIKDRETKLLEMEDDYQKLSRENDRLKKESERNTSEKIASLQEHIQQVDKKIAESVKAERNAEIILQGNMVECDIFAKKLREAEETLENLKKAAKNFPQPTQVFRQKRSIEEISNSSLNRLTSVKDCIKYRMAKEGKKVRQK